VPRDIRHQLAPRRRCRSARNFCLARLPNIRVDDWVFGVSSVGADGLESPVAAAVPGGAFRPYTPPSPPPAQQ
jgi:hypothetical protein